MFPSIYEAWRDFFFHDSISPGLKFILIILNNAKNNTSPRLNLPPLLFFPLSWKRPSERTARRNKKSCCFRRFAGRCGAHLSIVSHCCSSETWKSSRVQIDRGASFGGAQRAPQQTLCCVIIWSFPAPMRIALQGPLEWMKANFSRKKKTKNI